MHHRPLALVSGCFSTAIRPVTSTQSRFWYWFRFMPLAMRPMNWMSFSQQVMTKRPGQWMPGYFLEWHMISFMWTILPAQRSG